MRKADIITRAIAGLVDLLCVIGLARLPDVIGFLSATGYILIRDGLFDQQSIGKKLIGLRVATTDSTGMVTSFRESIIRNVPLAVAYFLFMIPYAGWALGTAALCAEALAAIGDRQGMRIGDMLARTIVVNPSPVPAASQPSEPVVPAAASGGESSSDSAHPQQHP